MAPPPAVVSGEASEGDGAAVMGGGGMAAQRVGVRGDQSGFQPTEPSIPQGAPAMQ